MLMDNIIIIAILLGVAVLIAWAGYRSGLKRRNCICSILRNPNVDSNDDSIEQARMIGRAIEQRALVLGNPGLSTARKIGEKTRHYYAFGGIEEFKTDNAEAFMKGNCVNLIRFCRVCHSYGISIRLRQIGLKDAENPTKPSDTFISRPEATLFLKN